VLTEVDAWPQWWPAVKRVELLEPGDAEGLGALRRMTWRTALPYSLSFDMRTLRVEPKGLIEGRVSGELDGTGRWTLHAEQGGTYLRYDWIVTLSKPWMRAMAPVLRPVFAWNHEKVMGWGLKGIRARLGSQPVGASSSGL
ncbi:MAG: SRPBCC family protein, partial [Asticcacaulis sp.]